MDINEIFKTTEGSIDGFFSELVETQCMIKSMLSVILAELCHGDPDKERALVAQVNELKDQELLRVIARFAKGD